MLGRQFRTFGECGVKNRWIGSRDKQPRWINQVLSDATNTFFASLDARTALLLRLRTAHKTLGEYTESGIARGVSPDIAEAHVGADGDQDLKKLEKAVLRRSISGKRIKRYGAVTPDQWITDQQIDTLVYALYGLTPDEIALVEVAV